MRPRQGFAGIDFKDKPRSRSEWHRIESLLLSGFAK